MTPEDRELDQDIFSKPELTLYRLARKEYANLSGVGAALYPGRWNQAGKEAIYTSIDMSTTVLERLVHTPKGTVPTDLAIMQITLKQNWGFWQDPSGELSPAGELVVFPSLAKARNEFDRDGFQHAWVLGVAVPSVIVPSWNVVLYPKHFLFWRHVSLKSIEKFEFDPRLFPDIAVATI